jgi:hypothetical protein
MLAFGAGLLGVAAACSGTGSSESGSSAGAGSPNAGTSGAIQPAAGGGSPGLGAAGVSGGAGQAASAGTGAGAGMSSGGTLNSAAGTSGSGGAGGVSCPTAPPFDSSDAELVAMCAKIVYASVGDNLRRALSFDGTTWTNDVENTDASQLAAARMGEYELTGLVIQNGIILTSGDGGVFRSVDGATWLHIEDTATGLPSGIALHQTRVGFGRGGAFGTGLFGITGNGGTWTSSDGAVWTSWKDDQGKIKGTDIDASFSGHGKGAAFGNEKLIFAGDDNVTRIFDGTTWTVGKIDGLSETVSDLGFGNGVFIGVTDSGERAVSADGVTWNSATDGSFRFGNLFVDSDGKHIYASATEYSRQLYASLDGLTWTTTNTDTGFFGIVLHDGLWVGAQQTGISTSTDGKTFTNRTKTDEFGLYAAALGYVLK